MIAQAFRAGLRHTVSHCRNDRLQLVQKRFSGDGKWYYRETPVASEMNRNMSHVFMTATWAWIFWHLFTEPEHIYGHYVEPDVSSWTDEELGVVRD